MINAKSYIAARNINDVLSQLGIGPWLMKAYGTEVEDRIIIQYRSEELGETRQVMAEPRKLVAWMRPRATRPRFMLLELKEILDRKPVRPAPPQQGMLWKKEELPPMVDWTLRD